jgi:hypothetical protein
MACLYNDDEPPLPFWFIWNKVVKNVFNIQYLDLGSYENVIAIVKVNFLRVQKQKSEFKSFSELMQVEILLT